MSLLLLLFFLFFKKKQQEEQQGYELKLFVLVLRLVILLVLLIPAPEKLVQIRHGFALARGSQKSSYKKPVYAPRARPGKLSRARKRVPVAQAVWGVGQWRRVLVSRKHQETVDIPMLEPQKSVYTQKGIFTRVFAGGCEKMDRGVDSSPI
jgi:hypothetical protein